MDLLHGDLEGGRGREVEGETERGEGEWEGGSK